MLKKEIVRAGWMLVSIWFLFVVCEWTTGASKAASTDTSITTDTLIAYDQADENVDDFDDKVNWDLLHFGSFTDRKIDSIKIVITEDDEEKIKRFYGLLTLLEPATIQITDAETLTMAEFCLSEGHCIRPVIPSGIHGGSSGAGLPFGEIEIKTNDETILIGLTMEGYALESRTANINNVFFAPMFTEYLQEVYCRKSGSNLPRQIEDALTGNAKLSQAKATFRQLRIKPAD